jgi:CubicO group peptidase (beta-lactamase class C family)/D-alanyl-D-alanine dipeptidase
MNRCDRNRDETAREYRCAIVSGFLVLIILLLNAQRCLAADVLEPKGAYRDVVKRLEPWIGSEVESKGLPALSIALVDDQQIVWARGFGFANPAKQTPATADTAYRVGSVSKLFTDLALMQLVEQGKLDLDAPITKILPDFTPKNPLDVPITLRHLMSHRSGLVREPPIGHYFDPTSPSLADVLRSLNATTLVYKPGTRSKYSNAGVTVVGAAVEKVVGEPFPAIVKRGIFTPLGMTRSSFQPDADLAQQMAVGMMWSYDNQTIANPTFLLGTGPAGNLVSTVSDLGKFLSMLFAKGKGVVRRETLQAMFEPQFARTGESSGFGLGFAFSKLDGYSRVGHGGAIYGFATELAALPEPKLGVVVIASRDCANGATRHIAYSALRLMLAAHEKRPLPTLESSTSVSPVLASRIQGRYVHEAKAVDVYSRNNALYLNPNSAGQRVEIRALGEGLHVDDRLTRGPSVSLEGDKLIIGKETYKKTPVATPTPVPDRWAGLIGEYGWDHDVLYVLEKNGQLHVLIEWFFEYPLKEEGPDVFRFPDWGLYDGERLVFRRGANGSATEVEAASVVFKRRKLDGEDGSTFRITPTRPVEAIRSEFLSAKPPVESGEFRMPDLVDLAALDPSIHLDIRYATTNNFLGVPLYTSARAFLQRPAAVALGKAHKALAKDGYGLLIHDAYRPWNVTKLFWEATPESGHTFVADPAKGSRHNRGSAVDLTLYELATGKPAQMVGGYDEFSPRSFPDYPGGTSLQRWQRDLLRQAMEAQGFTVNEFEWWHFDHKDWAKYPILDKRFEDLK